jgi:hypothetical protein
MTSKSKHIISKAQNARYIHEVVLKTFYCDCFSIHTYCYAKWYKYWVMLVIGIRSSSIGMKHEIVTSREIKSEKIGSPPKKCEIRRGEYMCAYFLKCNK